MLRVMENNQKMRSIRFKEAFDYLKENGVINSQKDLAERLRVVPETITRVIKCQGKNPTDKFMEKFALSFNTIFNESYILNGVGKLLKTDEQPNFSNLAFIEKLFEQLENKDKTISFLQQQITEKDNTIRLLRQMLEGRMEEKPLDKKAM